MFHPNAILTDSLKPPVSCIGAFALSAQTGGSSFRKQAFPFQKRASGPLLPPSGVSSSGRPRTGGDRFDAFFSLNPLTYTQMEYTIVLNKLGRNLS